ncbi:hypothetical protein ACH4PU_30925 [Streptomyces sp. NPDC021100]|uniref:hypothetical protein n=1 Tax=Streptomyces sp. NPDC021100 TaxID=3365114 RepID=UPI00379F310F
MESETLGLAPGHYQAGPLPLGLDGAGRTLYRVSAAEAAAITAEGATIRTPAACPDWPHPFAVPVTGMRLRDLRAFLQQHGDLSDDTAELDVRIGWYVPDLCFNGPRGAFWNPRRNASDPRPDRSIPAVLISPSA